MQNYQLFTITVIYLELYNSGPPFRHTSAILCTYVLKINSVALSNYILIKDSCDKRLILETEHTK